MNPAPHPSFIFWPSQRVDLGVPDTLIRLSVGIEDVEDLLVALQAASAAR